MSDGDKPPLAFVQGRPNTRRSFNGLGGATLTRAQPEAHLTDTMNRSMLVTHITATGYQFASKYPPVIVKYLTISGLPVNMGNMYMPISVFGGNTGFALGEPRLVAVGQEIRLGVRLKEAHEFVAGQTVGVSAGLVGFELWPEDYEIDPFAPLMLVLGQIKDPDKARELLLHLADVAARSTP